MSLIQRFQSKSGVTLLELMITVVIIGLASAMAVPQLARTYRRLQFRSEIKDMTSSLKLARSMAITTKNQYGVYFDTGKRTVTLFKDVVNLSNYDFASGDSLIRVDTLPSQFTYLGTDIGNNAVVFLPNGTAGFTGGGNVYSIAASSEVVGIQSTNVLASTGRVHTQFWYY